MGKGLNKSIIELDHKLNELKEMQRSEERELIKNSVYDMLRLDNQYNIYSLDRSSKRFTVDAKKILYLIDLINNDLSCSKMNGFEIDGNNKSVHNITIQAKDVEDFNKVISRVRQMRMGIS